MRAPDFIRDRARTMRRTLTMHEKQLRYLLRRNQLGLHFRRQHPVGPFVLDFSCAEAKLCIEIDGPMHDEQQDYDQRRTGWLTKEGIRVLRFSVEELELRQAVVLATIAQAAPPTA